jgi:hypothetical protein
MDSVTGIAGDLKLIKLAFLKWIDKNQRSSAFVIALSLFLLLHYASGVTEFYFDSSDYWQLSSISNLFNFPRDGIRGYVYPTLLSPARFLSDLIPSCGLMPFRLFSSLFYAYALTILLPSFYTSIFGGKLSFWRRLITPALIAALFPGVILYPLADLPAVIFMLGALFCVKRSADVDQVLSRCLLLILSGMLAYGAYNARTIFLFPMILGAFAATIVTFRNHNMRTKICAIALFLIGAVISSIPQGLINLKSHGAFWPGVITTRENRSLFANQLLWGITVQRYETSIERSSPAATLFYLDKVGERLFRENKIGDQPFNVSTYLTLVLKNPIEFIGIYGRHVVNGLDVRDGNIYTNARSADRNILSALNFLIVLSGLIIIATGAYRSFNSQNNMKIQFIFGSLIMMPVIMVIPGAIESRFFLPLHLAIYSALAFGSDIAVFRQLDSKRLLLIALVFGVSALMFFSVSTATMSNLQFEYSDLYRGKW